MLTGLIPVLDNHSFAETNALSIPSESGLPGVEDRKSLNAIIDVFLKFLAKNEVSAIPCLTLSDRPQLAERYRSLCKRLRPILDVQILVDGKNSIKDAVVTIMPIISLAAAETTKSGFRLP